MPAKAEAEPDIALALLSLDEQIKMLTKILGTSQRSQRVKLETAVMEDGFYLTARVNKSTICVEGSPAAGGGGGTVKSIEALPYGSLLVTTLEGETYFVSPAMVRKGLVLTEEK